MRSILLAIVWAASALAIPTGEGLRERQDDNQWVVTWTSMPQEVEPGNLPPSPFVRSILLPYGVALRMY